MPLDRPSPPRASLSLLSGGAFVLGALAVGPLAAIDPSWLEQKRAEADVPGVAAAWVRSDGLSETAVVGLRDSELELPVAVSTPFLIASVSKLVTATAVMQLEEDGRFGLDDPVAPHLGFPLVHPQHPSMDITFRMLLTHSASIRDDWDVLEPLIVEGDSPIPLGSFLEDYLTPPGSTGASWGSWAPGSRFEYTNVGFALLGHLVERIDGRTFSGYCRDEIFEPAGLGEAGTQWFLAGFPDVDVVARPHEWVGGWDAIPHYGFPDYPDGQLRTNAGDLARFALVFLTGGTAGGARILGAATVDRMLSVDDPELDPVQGLGFYRETVGGREVFGHNGGDVGASADLYLDPSTGTAALVLANAEPWETDPIEELLTGLFQEAEAAAPTPVFVDGFETGDRSAWSGG